MAGVLADKMSRRRLMAITNLARFLIVLLYFPAIWFGSAEMILALLFIQHCLAAFFEPARSALIPDLVTNKALYSANAGLAAGWSIMMALGMSLGGFLVYLSNPEMALLVDALTYLIAYILLQKITISESHFEHNKVLHFADLFRLDDYKASIKYLKEIPAMIPVVASKGALEVATGGFIFLLTILGETEFHFFESTALSVGLLQAARGLGTGAGPLVSRRFFKTQYSNFYSLWFWLLVIPLGYAMVSFQTDLVWILLFVFVAHCGGGANWVNSENLIHQLVPNKIRGRIVSFEFVLLTLLMSLSVKGTSLLIDLKLLTGRESMQLLALAGVLVAFFWLGLSAKFAHRLNLSKTD